MEVIEGPTEWSRQVECPHKDCGAKLRAKIGDVKYDSWQYFDDSGSRYYVNCLTCGTTIGLEDLPPNVTSDAQKRYGEKGKK